jgi:tetratricopeptide (TPR) repeat protein/CHAT domain-containing protein
MKTFVLSWALSLIFFLFSCLGVTQAQKIPDAPNQTNAQGKKEGKWVIMTDDNFQPVKNISQAAYYRVATYKNGVPQGKVNDFYISGEKQWEGTLTSEDPDVIDGVAYWYFKNGKLQEQTTFKNGIPEGAHQYYHENGNLAAKGTMSEGYKDGKWITYHENGKIASEITYAKGIIPENTSVAYYDLNGSEIEKGDPIVIYKKFNEIAVQAINKQDYAAAVLPLERLVELTDGIVGKGNETYMSMIGNLAMCYYYTAQYKKAEPCFIAYTQVVDYLKKPKDAQYGNNLMLAAQCQYNLGKMNAADATFKRAAEQMKESFGELSSEFAFIAGVYGTFLRDNDRLEQAEKYYLASAEAQKAKTADAGFYAITINNLGITYYKMGKYEKSENYFKQALALHEKTSGTKSNDYAETLNGLGALYLATGRYTESENTLLKSLEIHKNNTGINSAKYANVAHNLASTYLEIGNYTQAEKYYNEALQTRKKLFGEVSKEYTSTLSETGGLYLQLANYTKAEQVYLTALANWKQLYGENHPKIASLYNNLGSFYEETAQYPKAEKYYGKAAEINKNYLGENHAEYGANIYNLAKIYRKTGRLIEAEKYYQSAVSIQEKAVGKTHKSYANALNGLAMLYEDKSDFKKAENIYLQIIEIYQKALGANANEYATACGNLGALYVKIGNYIKASEYIERALTIDKQNYGEKHPQYAITLNNKGGLLLKMGKYPQAEQYFLQTLAIRKETIGENHPLYGMTLLNLAQVYFYTNEFEKADSLALKGLNTIKKVYGENNAQYALAISNTGVFYEQAGKYAQAEQFHKQALTILKQINADKTENYALALNNLATNYIHMNNLTAAIKSQLQAVDLQEKIFGKNHPDYANSLNNLANMYSMAQMDSVALDIYANALHLYKNIYGNTSHPDYAQTAANYAGSLAKLGKDADAEKYYLLAGEAYKSATSEKNINYALILNNLGYINFKKSDYTKADDYYKQAIEMLIALVGEKYPKLADLWFNRALNQYAAGNNATTRTYLDKAIEIYLYQIKNTFAYLSEEEKEFFYEKIVTTIEFDDFFSYKNAAQQTQGIGEIYNLQLSTKALLFNALNRVRTNIMKSNNEPLKQKYRTWQSKHDLLAKVYQMTETERKEKGIDEAALENEVNNLEKEISLQSENFSKAKEQLSYTWQDVQKNLRNGEAAVEIVRFRNYEKNNWTEKVIYLALIVKPETKNNPEMIVISENGQELDTKYYKNYITSIKKEIDDDTSYPAYWQKIANSLAGVKKVFISPDGIYNQISLNTLKNPTTGKYVIDEIDLQLLSNTKDLARLTRKELKETLKSTTLFGFPDYNNSSGSNTTSPQERQLSAEQVEALARFTNGADISMLPGTKIEVEAIETLLKQKGVNTALYLSTQANEKQLKNLKTSQILHIATHGYFMRDAQKLKNSPTAYLGIENQKAISNPLFRSGLLLSGAKYGFVGATNNLQEDGILTAYEAMSLDLEGTDLVVMSACETGLGEVRNGEGVYGLQRAFQVAGAKAVLMSLWTVSDEATQQLMTSFYTYWLQTGNKKEAFRTAQLSLRQKYNSPYYWGAFVMVGE